MTEYRRTNIAGATYFFTVNCAERRDNQLLVNPRQVFRRVKKAHPFQIDAMVVLPDHFTACLMRFAGSLHPTKLFVDEGMRGLDLTS